jgi:hypothetical protein
MYFTPAIKIGRAPSPDTVPGRPLAIVARFTHSSGVICRHAAPTDKQCSSILCSRGLPRSPSPAAVPSPYANANKPAARLAPRRIDRRCHTTRRCVARPVAPPQGAQRLANSKKIRSAHPRPAARRAPRRHGQAGTARTRDASADPLSRPRRGVLARWRHYSGAPAGARDGHHEARTLQAGAAAAAWRTVKPADCAQTAPLRPMMQALFTIPVPMSWSSTYPCQDIAAWLMCPAPRADADFTVWQRLGNSLSSTTPSSWQHHGSPPRFTPVQICRRGPPKRPPPFRRSAAQTFHIIYTAVT